MKRITISRLVLCVLCGASIFVVPSLASAGWVAQNSGTGYTLRSVHFPVDAQTGYVVGDSGTILKTTNGGTNWDSLPSWPTYRLGSVHFPLDTQTGYTVGYSGTIFKTTDGGANWVGQNSGTASNLYSVHFPHNTQTGYTVGDSGTILKTTDGGASWVVQNSGTFSHLRSVQFPVDNVTGYAVGTGVIMKTTDGGTTWVSNSYNLSALSVQFPIDTQTGYVVGQGEPDITKTRNGGNLWLLVPMYFHIINSVWFPMDAQTGYVVGDSGYIEKTINGGEADSSWAGQNSGTPHNLYSVHFPVDAQTGYAVGDSGTILKTTDGGGVGVEESRQGDRVTRGQGVKATPNPFTSSARVAGHEGERFSLYDISGRMVGTYFGNRIGEGLAAGVYFLRSANNKDKPLRVVKIR